MKLKLLLLIVIPFLHSCSIGSTKTSANASIDNKVKNEISDINTKLFEAIFEGDNESLNALLSEKLLNSIEGDPISMFNSLRSLSLKPQYKFDEYHVSNSTVGMTATARSGLDSLDYQISYEVLNPESYVSIYILPISDLHKLSVLIVYGKYTEGWRINILQFGSYMINGQIAPELFFDAKSEYEKGHLINAANSITFCKETLHPSKSFWKYNIDDRITELENSIFESINQEYQFPISIGEVQVFNISPINMEKGFSPMIKYQTQIDIKDTVKLKIENDLIHKLIGEVFKGIDKNNKFIFYRAFNELPAKNKTTPYYGFGHELKKVANK